MDFMVHVYLIFKVSPTIFQSEGTILGVLCLVLVAVRACSSCMGSGGYSLGAVCRLLIGVELRL